MRRERIVTASTMTVGVLLAVALFGMINWISYRHYVRSDWTSSKLYTLSGKTDHVLASLDTDVSVVVFMTPQTPLFDETRELLTRYQAASPRIHVEFIDPDRNPLRTQQLAKEYGVSAANTVVFSAGVHKKYVSSDQLAEYDYSGVQYGQGPKLKAFKGEEQFTSAILAVVNPAQPRVYFTTGHGEHDPASSKEDGYSELAAALKRDNLDVQTTTLLSGSVPKDCDVLVVAGPTAPFAEVEKKAITDYIASGGRALVMLDPVLGGRQRPSGLAELLRAYGIVADNDIVVDPDQRLPLFGLETVYTTKFGSHPVVDGMEGLAVLLPIARSIGTVTVPGVTDTTLLSTSAGGWGETDIAGILAGKSIARDDKDIKGPVSLGVAAEPSAGTGPQEAKDAKDAKDAKWRLIVFGDSDFAANGSVSNAGNLNLGLNAVNWLARQQQALGIAPRQPEQVSLYLSAAQMRGITLLALVGLPGAAILLGVAVWWRRRR